MTIMQVSTRNNLEFHRHNIMFIVRLGDISPDTGYCGIIRGDIISRYDFRTLVFSSVRYNIKNLPLSTADPNPVRQNTYNERDPLIYGTRFRLYGTR